MLDINQGGMGGGYEFAAQPKLINQRPKYKDPYGGSQE